jgi:hypothetical protein
MRKKFDKPAPLASLLEGRLDNKMAIVGIKKSGTPTPCTKRIKATCSMFTSVLEFDNQNEQLANIRNPTLTNILGSIFPIIKLIVGERNRGITPRVDAARPAQSGV